MERRPNSLVCALQSTSQHVSPLGISVAMGLKEKGRSVWLVATLGPFGPGVKLISAGPYARCRGVSTDQTTISVVTDSAHVWVEKLEQGPESQAASAVCSWSVGRHGHLRSRCTHSSAVERPAISCRAHCLLGRIDRLWIGVASPACLD